ncbi:MAG TPA: hypothetical protein PKC80_02170 [Burkholderiaceae bacterium]|nr:hypothetical protein [Burkholderiaceae bacterium]
MANENIDERISLIKDRLEFVSMITALHPQFLNPDLIRVNEGDDGWTHPWMYFDGLRNYLLLTCFDLLGQPDHFMDFDSWLTSSKTATAREEVLGKITNQGNLSETIKNVYKEYKLSYGTKHSFFKFLNEVLTEEMRVELADDIWIHKNEKSTNKRINSIEGNENKFKGLYNIRNSFTHAGINTGSIGAGVFTNFGEMTIDGVLKKGYQPVSCIRKKDTYTITYVRDWPDVLIRAVEYGVKQLEMRSPLK